MRIISTCSANEQLIKTIAEQETVPLVVQMLNFYMGLLGTIQLASIYDSLKLLNLLIQNN